MTSVDFPLYTPAAECADAGTRVQWIECPDCGKMQTLPPPREGYVRSCIRCAGAFGEGQLRAGALLALSLSALLLLIVVYAQPLLGIFIQGRYNDVSVADATRGLFHQYNATMALLC